MCKICIFLVYNDSLEAFCKTIESLTQAIGFEDARLVIIFDRMMYELDIELLTTLEQLPSENVKCLYNINSNDMLKSVIEEISDEEVFFFIDEGDTIDTTYLTYIGYFFEENSEECGVLLMPVVEASKEELPEAFVSLPNDGIRRLEFESEEVFLPSSTKGVVLVSSVFNDIVSSEQEGTSAFYEAILKAIIQKSGYGIINTVSYFSDTTPESYISLKLLKSLADYSIEIHNAVPNYLVGIISDYVNEQFKSPAEDINMEIFALREYAPEIFNEIDETPFSLYIMEVKDYYSNAEITGRYTRSFFSKEKGLRISSRTNAPVEYKEQTGGVDGWKQEINFKAMVNLENNEANLQFELLTGEESELIETVEFPALDEETGKINNYVISQEAGAMHIKRIAPRAYYKVSCIIPIYNGAEYLKEAVESVIAQTIGFFVNIQVILINNGSTDDTESICLEYVQKYPYNISYFYREEVGVSKARNHGLQYAVGEYISFLDSDDKLPPNYMRAAIKYLESDGKSVDMVALPIENFGAKDEQAKPRHSFRFEKPAIIDLEVNPHYIHFSACSTIIRRNAIGRIEFNEELSYSEDAEFVHKVLLNKMKYGVLDKPSYLYRTRDDGSSAMQSKEQNMEWYGKNAVFGKSLIEYSLEKYGHVTKYTQNLIIFELLNSAIPKLPDEVEGHIDIPSITQAISESLQYVEDDVIKTSVMIKDWFKCFLLKLKHHGVTLKKEGNVLAFYIGGAMFQPLKPKINITALVERNNCLCVSGFYNLPSYEGIKLIALYNGQAYPASETENHYANIYFLGEPVHKASVFDLAIPYTEEGIVEIYMQVENTDALYPVELEFPNKQENDDVTGHFAVGQNIIMLSTQQTNQIKLEYRTHRRLSESINVKLKRFMRDEFKGDYGIINEYLSMYPIMSKSRIWLFMDEPQSARGSAEAMFSFCSNIKDGIDKFFVIDKNTLDGVRLGDIGTVVQYGSDMHKLLYLYAEKVIVSNVLDNRYDPCAGSGLNCVYNSIIKSKLIYLPNDPQATDTSLQINRFTKNISLFATISEEERQIILDGNYGYDNDIVQAVGLPRYDGLIDEEQRKLVFMPTWREKLYLGQNELNFDFVNSEYCRKIGELLCDERLLEAMQEYDYEMCFAPHSKTYLQVSDFDMYENVEVISPAFPKQDVFTRASLVITDCMPVFDFAYMKKPIIYYDFAEDEGVPSDGSTLKFGESVSDTEALIDKIIEYMQNGCVMPDEYMQQVDEYFKFTDNKNSERIYSILKNME